MQTVSPSMRIQTPVSSGSNSFTGFFPPTISASSRHRDRRRSEVRRVALARQNGDLGVGRQEVREQAVALLDAVVVVRHRLAWLDRSVLGRGLVRRDSAREPGRVESHLVSAARSRHRVDVAEDALVARLTHGVRVGVVREVEPRERAGSSDRGDGDDGKNDECGLHGDTAPGKVGARRGEKDTGPIALVSRAGAASQAPGRGPRGRLA